MSKSGISLNRQSDNGSKPRISVARASTRFSISGSGGIQGFGNNKSTNRDKSGSEATYDSLHVENERLKTTLTILTQKIKMKDDDSQVQIEKLKTENNQLGSKNKQLTNNNETLQNDLKAVKKQLANTGNNSKHSEIELK